jgi:hypothetical protein
MTRAKSFTDVDGREVTVRPVYDAGMARTVVELVVHGATVRLSPGIIADFSDTVLMAALCGELVNIASGNPSTSGA